MAGFGGGEGGGGDVEDEDGFTDFLLTVRFSRSNNLFPPPPSFHLLFDDAEKIWEILLDHVENPLIT